MHCRTDPPHPPFPTLPVQVNWPFTLAVGIQAIEEFMEASSMAQQHRDALRGSLTSLLIQLLRCPGEEGPPKLPQAWLQQQALQHHQQQPAAPAQAPAAAQQGQGQQHHQQQPAAPTQAPAAAQQGQGQGQQQQQPQQPQQDTASGT